MSDEPTQIDCILHQTTEHSPDGWRKLSKSLIELNDDDRLLIEYTPTLRAEVIRLRNGIRSILSDYDITELIRDVPEDEWNFEQKALVLLKELIE